MRLKILITVILVMPALNCTAQQADTINRTDQKGLKQGYWIKRFPSGTRQYEGWFRDDKPVGTFRRYYETDTLRSVMIHSTDGKSAEAVLYHPNGMIASKGVYVNQLKEGKWSFYSTAQKDYLICEEFYRKNLKEGASLKYYPSGAILEKITYIGDIKHGEWLQYYPDGKVSLRANYVKGILEGTFEYYYPDGKPEYRGQYKNNARDGIWLVYKRDGKLKNKVEYVNGKAMNPELFINETRYLDSLERNRWKLEDPEKTGSQRERNSY
jgi:antitoxin component YwqK of YwqJK toxin-antitoxin module